MLNNRKPLIWMAALCAVLILAMGLAIGQSPLVSTASPLSAIPTSIPDQNSVPGDSVSRAEGGVFLNGIGIDGSEDEYQLAIEAYDEQTTDIVNVADSTGSELVAVGRAGALLVGGPAGSVITTPAAGDFLVADDAEFKSDVAVLGAVRGVMPAAVAVTQDSTIPATSSVIQLSAAASASTSSIAAGASGQILIIVGPASNTVTFTDTGTLKLGGDRALSANDTLTLVSDGTNWNEVAFVDN